MNDAPFPTPGPTPGPKPGPTPPSAPEPGVPAPPAKRRGRLARLLETLGAVLIALVLAEVGARFFLRLPERTPPQVLDLKVRVPEAEAPGMFECLRRNGHATAHYPEAGGEGLTIEYRTNAEGFRDRQYPRERRPGTCRIAVLGDSVAFGFGIGARETAPKFLEALLAEEFGPGHVEVMNCGIYSYNAVQQVAHLAYRVLDFRPDVVLFLTTVTDATGTGIPPRPVEGEAWEVAWIKRLGLTSGRFDPGELEVSAAQRRMLWLRRHSALADYVANRAYTWMRSRLMSESYLLDWQPGLPGREAVRGAYRRARDLGAEHGFEMRVAMVPVLDELDDYPLGPVHDDVEALCAELGVAYLDLLPALAGLDARSLHAHAHDKHPNGEANRRMAELLAADLAPVVRGILAE